MAHKYYEHTLQGEHAPDEVHEALGAALGDGLIVRTDTQGGVAESVRRGRQRQRRRGRDRARSVRVGRDADRIARNRSPERAGC